MEKTDRLIAAVDFETFYDTKSNYTLTDMTPYEYVHDDRFDAYLVAVAYSDGRPTFVGNPKDYDWSLLDDAQLLAHNATFDGMVLRRLEELGIVEPKPRYWLDTADMVAFLGVTRNLKTACKELLDLDISKAVRTAMDGKTDRDLYGQELKDLYDYGGSDAEECLQLFLKYGHKWPEIERRISTQNRNAAWYGINVDAAKVNEGIAYLSKVKDEAEAQLPWVKQGFKAGSNPALAKAVEALGIPAPASFRKNDPRFLDWEKQYGDKCPFLKARIVYAGTAPHIARLVNLRDHLCEGLYHSDIRYFGTHTGRTASGSRGDKESESASKINLLNLTKQKIHGVVDMRGMFIPRPGYKFIIYDFSSIEARVVKWLAGDDSFIDMIRDEGDMYQAEAVKMGWIQAHGPSLKKTNKPLRQLAKAACLTEDSLILVKNGLTKPFYKRIIDLTSTDMVFDGHEWVHHHGVRKMRTANDRDIKRVGTSWFTRDHKVYTGDTSKEPVGSISERELASALSWGQSCSPLAGWDNVRALALAIGQAIGELSNELKRKASKVLDGRVRVHLVRRTHNPGGHKPEPRKVNEVHEVRSQSSERELCAKTMGEKA